MVLAPDIGLQYDQNLTILCLIRRISVNDLS